MSRRSFRRLLTAVLLYAPAAFSALFETPTRDLAAAAAGARAERKDLAVMFELAGCALCERMKRDVLRDAATEAFINRRFHTVTVQLDAAAPLLDPTGHLTTPQALAERLHIVATPAFAFFTGDGRLLYRYVGGLAAPADFQLLGRYVSEAGYEQQPFAEYRRRRP